MAPVSGSFHEVTPLERDDGPRQRQTGREASSTSSGLTVML